MTWEVYAILIRNAFQDFQEISEVERMTKD